MTEPGKSKYKSDSATIYLMAEAHIENSNKKLCIKDICEVHCEDTRIQALAENLRINSDTEDKNGRMIISILTLISMIEKAVQQQYPDMEIEFENIGEAQIIVERHPSVNAPWWITAVKIGFVSLILFVGAGFTIMTYDQDVNAADIFERIYQLVLGYVPERAGILELTYSIGIAIGILMFFNPFTSSKKRKEPSPIEIEMEKYETDIQDTIVKIHGRSKEGK